MAEFPSVIQLSTLNGNTGFRVEGVYAESWTGWSASTAGDINGDGFDDVVIGARFADANGDESGASYVVFGRAGGFASSINLSSLDGTNGFRMPGASAFHRTGAVSDAGDINGDGFDDFIVGAPYAALFGAFAGAAYVVFGKAGGFTSSILQSSLDGTNGFRIIGAVGDDRLGIGASTAGDVNGDGFDDLIVGALGADPNGDYSGAAYVVFGKASGFASAINVSTLNGSNGFRIEGVGALALTGHRVSNAGDINNDGFDDVIIATSGPAYVVFGKASGFAPTISVSALDGTNGFSLATTLGAVSNAGDVNADGYADLIVGSSTFDEGKGASFLVFGKAAFPASITLNPVDGITNVVFQGVNAGDRSGTSVSSAGDVNGDGFDDLIIGAYGADPNGAESGASYVVFGRPNFSPSTALSTLNGSNGFRLDGVAASDQTGSSVSSAGDVNGDGFDDLIIGAPRADLIGTDSGAGYVIFGFRAQEAVSRVGTNIANRINGGIGADTIAALGGHDTILGWESNDTIFAGGDNDNADGGSGDDAIEGSLGDDTLVGSFGNDTLFGGAGNDVLNGESGIDIASYAGGSATAVVVDLSIAGAQNTQGDGFDHLIGIQGLIGTGFGDRLSGDDFANQLMGANGNDTLHGNLGDDTLDGGAQFDFANYGLLNIAVTVNLTIAVAQNTGQGNDQLNSIEGVIGSALGDALTGGTSASLLGGAGNDTLTGGAGNDTLDGGGDVDTAVYFGAGAAVTINLNSVVAQNTGGAGLDQLTGIEGVIGSIFNDTLIGNAGHNHLEGAGGNDTLIGGAGNDTLNGGGGINLVTYAGVGGPITVFLGSSLDQNTGEGIDRLLAIANAIGSSFGDDIAGSVEANVLDGGAGNDTLTAFGGNDTLVGGAGNDTMDGGGNDDTASYAASGLAVNVDLSLAGAQNTRQGFDQLIGIEHLVASDFDDTVTGSAGNNSLEGGSGNDTLQGGAGNDTLSGGDDDDTASYAAAGSRVIVNLSNILAQNTQGAGTDVLGSIEILFGSNFGDILFGAAGDERVAGGGGDDTVAGGAGNDVLEGGAGFDGAYYGAAAAGVSVNLTKAVLQNTQGDGVDLLTGFEAVFGSEFNDTITGSAIANRLDGNGGNDSLTAGAGNDTVSAGLAKDTVRGGDGNDTFIDTDGMSTTETDIYDGGNGIDLLVHDLTWTSDVTFDLNLGFAIFTTNRDQLISIENLTIGGAAAIIGSNLANILTVNGTGNNAIQGLDGNDSIEAGGGNDTIAGGAGNDTINGGAGADLINGGDDNDLIRIFNGWTGGVGEVFDGGDGIDTFDASVITVDTTTINLDAGTFTHTPGGSGFILLANFENVTTGASADSITGNALSNTFRTGGGADSIDGGGGVDYLFGGLGGDTLNGGASFDYVRYDDANYGNLRISLINAATNTGTAAAGDTYIGIEGVIAGAGNDSVTGNALNNNLFGLSGNDVLYGGLGADKLDGGADFDYARYDDANYGNLVISLTNPATNTGAALGDIYVGIEGLVAGAGNDTVTGDTGNNILVGLGGGDLMYGREGKDYFYLGAGGADTVRFDTALSAANIDTIYDFGAANDTIQLSQSVFSTFTQTGFLNTFNPGAFNTGTAASQLDDRIIYNAATGALIYDTNGSLGGGSQHFATLSAGLALTSANFWII